MKILALDSSGMVASVAIVEEEQVIGVYTINYKKTHSQTLLPMLDELSRQIELDMEEIAAIAVSGGPGSFTGLRIGAATAKGFGLALNKPIINIPTAEAMAYQLYGSKDLICPIMDARREQVYTGIYTFDKENKFIVVEEQMAVPMLTLIEKLNELGKVVIFLGDGVPVYRQMIEKQMEVSFVFAPPHCNRQDASALGALGIEYYKAGKIEKASEHQPNYLRVSQAERERIEREEKNEKQ